MKYSRNGARLECKYSPDQARDQAGKLNGGRVVGGVKPPFNGDRQSSHMSHDAATTRADKLSQDMQASGEHQTHDVVIHSAPQTTMQDGKVSTSQVHTIYKVPKA